MSKDYYQDEEFEGFEDFEEMEQELYEENEEWEPDTEEEDDDREPRRRRHHRGLKIFAGILVVITLALAGIIYGFRLEEVRVIGNKNYTVEEIKSLMGFRRTRRIRCLSICAFSDIMTRIYHLSTVSM